MVEIYQYCLLSLIFRLWLHYNYTSLLFSPPPPPLSLSLSSLSLCLHSRKTWFRSHIQKFLTWHHWWDMDQKIGSSNLKQLSQLCLNCNALSPTANLEPIYVLFVPEKSKLETTCRRSQKCTCARSWWQHWEWELYTTAARLLLPVYMYIAVGIKQESKKCLGLETRWDRIEAMAVGASRLHLTETPNPVNWYTQLRCLLHVRFSFQILPLHAPASLESQKFCTR